MSLLLVENLTLKALNTIAQGKRHRRATLGFEISKQINPVGVAQFTIVLLHPFRVRLVGIIYPRVARLRRLPWAMELSPFHKVTTYVAGQNTQMGISMHDSVSFSNINRISDNQVEFANSIFYSIAITLLRETQHSGLKL